MFAFGFSLTSAAGTSGAANITVVVPSRCASMFTIAVWMPTTSSRVAGASAPMIRRVSQRPQWFLRAGVPSELPVFFSKRTSHLWKNWYVRSP